MVDNVFLAETVLPIVKWELMYVPMLKKVKILYVLAVLGCGVCSAVCPRGVLKLENDSTKGRINPNDILLGNDVNLMDLVNQK